MDLKDAGRSKLAGLGYSVPVEDMSPAQFDETFAVNVRGIFLTTEAFLPDMKAKQSGTSVNIASPAGRNPVHHLATHAASRHAVLGKGAHEIGNPERKLCPKTWPTRWWPPSRLRTAP